MMGIDIHPERPRFVPVRKPGLTLISLFIWLGLVAALGMLIVGLSGCATAPAEPAAQVCYLKMMGTTDDGCTVVMQACVSPEKFAEGQGR